jgi:hypothetical protein
LISFVSLMPCDILYRARLNIRRASLLNAVLALTHLRGITRFAIWTKLSLG